jgi:hypothetical protein
MPLRRPVVAAGTKEMGSEHEKIICFRNRRQIWNRNGKIKTIVINK